MHTDIILHYCAPGLPSHLYVFTPDGIYRYMFGRNLSDVKPSAKVVKQRGY